MCFSTRQSHKVNKIEWDQKKVNPHEQTIQKDIGFDQLQCVDRENTRQKLQMQYILRSKMVIPSLAFDTYLPLYYIRSLGEVFSRSTHCSWSNPISFWIAYSWDASFFWSHPISFTLCRERAKKHFYPLIVTLFTVLLQFHNFFADENISRCSKITPF